MKVTKSEQVTYWDVDSTLIFHNNENGSSVSVKVVDPLTGASINVWPHAPMIRLMREEHARGGTIKVWSRGGWAWAEAVIKALALEKLVDEVSSKPMAYYDDLPIEEWLTNRVYLPPGTHYKGFC